MSTQPHFHGVTYQPENDQARLSSQLERIKVLMLDGRWRTLGEIRAVVGGSEAGLSARLRDLRKSRFGGYLVDRRRRDEPARGLHEYRVRTPEPPETLFDM